LRGGAKHGAKRRQAGPGWEFYGFAVAGDSVAAWFWIEYRIFRLISDPWIFDIVNRFLASGDWLWPIVGSIQVFDGKTCEGWGII
jgi:hypothetical protein